MFGKYVSKDALCHRLVQVLKEYESVQGSSNNYFKPPFQVTLAQYGGDIAGDAGENSDCGGLVHIQISYMISGPYSSWRRPRGDMKQRGSHSRCASTCSMCLPPLPLDGRTIIRVV